MSNKAVFCIFLTVLAALNLGSVRKSEDPIRDTQTNPILYEQKKEEEKDGKKGPLMYNVKNSPRANFFTDPPFEKEKKSSSQAIVTEEAPSVPGAADWWEERSTVPQAAFPAETVSEPSPEPLPEAEKALDHETAEQPQVVPEAESASSDKGDDHWW